MIQLDLTLINSLAACDQVIIQMSPGSFELDAVDRMMSGEDVTLLASMAKLKSVFWEGTDHWDTLLVERAEISGGLVLSDFTTKAISAFKRR